MTDTKPPREEEEEERKKRKRETKKQKRETTAKRPNPGAKLAAQDACRMHSSVPEAPSPSRGRMFKGI